MAGGYDGEIVGQVHGGSRNVADSCVLCAVRVPRRDAHVSNPTGRSYIIIGGNENRESDSLRSGTRNWVQDTCDEFELCALGKEER